MFALLTIPRGSLREEADRDDAEPVFGIVIRPPGAVRSAPAPLPVPAWALRSAGTTL